MVPSCQNVIWLNMAGLFISVGLEINTAAKWRFDNWEPSNIVSYYKIVTDLVQLLICFRLGGNTRSPKVIKKIVTLKSNILMMISIYPVLLLTAVMCIYIKSEQDVACNVKYLII